LIFTTTFAAAALSAVLSTAAIATPTWQSDYTTALAAASAQQKPVAVFIGRGEAGYATVVGGGAIPADAGQMLAKNFVCVYVDTDTAAGKSLAGQFDVTKGVVISCKGGNVQALRYTGTVAPAALTGYLTKYGEAQAVATTEKAGEFVVAPATYAPASQNFYPGFSTCPNGRCPNAR